MINSLLNKSISLYSVLYICVFLSNTGCSDLEGIESDLSVRAGVESFAQTANKSDSLTIVYFGGSITEAEGWRKYTQDWFDDYFSASKISFINSAIPGTSSFYGAFRADKDVISHKPDLVLIEFAVNDLTLNDSLIYKSIDGIVRKIYSADQDTDICFVYTLEQSKLDSVYSGSYFRSVRVMEEVADYYEIPSINFGWEVSNMVKTDSVIFTGDSPYIDSKPVFSSDGVHPYIQTGHKVYANIFIDRFRKIIENSRDNPSKNKQDFISGNLQRANMVSIDKINKTGKWKRLSNQMAYDYVKDSSRTYFSANVGSSLNFSFKGNYLGLSDIIGPHAGSLQLIANDKIMDTVYRFDPYSFFTRQHFFVKKIPLTTENEITFQFIRIPSNKREILNKKIHYDRDSSKYKDYSWIPSQLLYEGEIHY